MKQKFLFLLAALFSTMMAWAFTDFTEDNLWYEVTSENPKTVMLRGWSLERYSGDLIIPATVNGYSVTSIRDRAFTGCSDLTSVVIPGSVTSIGVEAFSYCSSLSSLEIADGVTSIEDYAFASCEGLSILEIPGSVTSIGEFAFFSCTGLTLIAVADDNQVFDSREDCNAIIRTNDNTLLLGCVNTVIPNSVTSIGDYSFNGCSDLTSIEIPNSVISIGDFAFQWCKKLTSIKIPNSVTSIGKEAFSWCARLNSVEIPASVTSIAQKAFKASMGISDIYCFADPDALTWVEDGEAFKPDKETLCHVEADKLAAYQEKFAEVNVTFVGDLTAGIESIAATATDDAWYTLAGVKLQGKPTVKGVYLYQGKAVLVK